MSVVTTLASNWYFYFALWLSLEIKFLLNKRIHHLILQVKLYRSWIKTNRETKSTFYITVTVHKLSLFLILACNPHFGKEKQKKVKKFNEPVLRTVFLRLSKFSSTDSQLFFYHAFRITRYFLPSQIYILLHTLVSQVLFSEIESAILGGCGKQFRWKK